MKRLVVFLVFLSIAAIASYLFYKEGSMAVSKSDKSINMFVIKQGESLSSIAKKLEKEGLIRNKLVFYLIVKRLRIERKIQAGDFRLSPSMDAEEIAKSLTHGTLDIWVTIIEGLRKEEIAQIISKSFDIPEVEFNKLATEGYLFPETYLIPRQASAQDIINIFKTTFDKKYNPELKNKAKLLGLAETQVITLASLVEKEAKYEEDRQKIASIILKRYKKDWPLQIDATLQYALGYQTRERTWWKKVLSNDDKEVDSPFNTYKNKGLPPAPIASPGIASLTSVVNADINTPYWYYLADNTGKTYYAVTIEEHNANIAKYLR